MSPVGRLRKPLWAQTGRAGSPGGSLPTIWILPMIEPEGNPACWCLNGAHDGVQSARGLIWRARRYDGRALAGFLLHPGSRIALFFVRNPIDAMIFSLAQSNDNRQQIANNGSMGITYL